MPSRGRLVLCRKLGERALLSVSNTRRASQKLSYHWKISGSSCSAVRSTVCRAYHTPVPKKRRPTSRQTASTLSFNCGLYRLCAHLYKKRSELWYPSLRHEPSPSLDCSRDSWTLPPTLTDRWARRTLNSEQYLRGCSNPIAQTGTC